MNIEQARQLKKGDKIMATTKVGEFYAKTADEWIGTIEDVFYDINGYDKSAWIKAKDETGKVYVNLNAEHFEQINSNLGFLTECMEDKQKEITTEKLEKTELAPTEELDVSEIITQHQHTVQSYPKKGIMNDLGEQIRNSRQSKGMTQRELARICSISTATIRKIEKGWPVYPRNLESVIMALNHKLIIV